MCNPTDNLVQYPLPYKVVDGCLCQETTKRNKPTTEKLCNFTAYIVNEVLFDDGVGTSRTMRIGGVHASGRKLPEIEVTANEFKKMDWVLERWGADCIIEPVPRAAERIYAAIQSTATFENTKDVYYKTGWKNIDGKWDYLLPGAGKHDVRLFGKLSRYEMAKDWSKSDLQTVWLMMKDKLIATKAIVWTLIALVFLTPLNEFLNQVLYMPKFVLYLIGRTGTRKSTLAALFLSFFGRFSGTDLPLSFSDTLNSILARCGSVYVNKTARRYHTRVSTKNTKGNMIMQTEKKTKISSVHFKYVGTDEQYNAFVKSVIKDYITDDSLLPDAEEEIIVAKKSA